MVAVVADHKCEASVPLGLVPARIDKAGRLPLPTSFLVAIGCFGGGSVYVTSLEQSILRLYPLGVWSRQQAALISANSRTARDVQFLLEDRGRDCRLDKRGRLRIHSDLIPVLGETAKSHGAVVLGFYRGYVNVYSWEAYVNRREHASEDLDSKVRALEEAGIL